MIAPPTQVPAAAPNIQDDPEAMKCLQIIMERGFAEQAIQMLMPHDESMEDEPSDSAIDSYRQAKMAPEELD